MKCPDCGAPSNVLSTRVRANGELLRRRECFNYHRFSTREGVVVERNLGRWNNRSSSEQAECERTTTDIG